MTFWIVRPCNSRYHCNVDLESSLCWWLCKPSAVYAVRLHWLLLGLLDLVCDNTGNSAVVWERTTGPGYFQDFHRKSELVIIKYKHRSKFIKPVFGNISSHFSTSWCLCTSCFCSSIYVWVTWTAKVGKYNRDTQWGDLINHQVRVDSVHHPAPGLVRWRPPRPESAMLKETVSAAESGRIRTISLRIILMTTVETTMSG